jgi:hypothetical protein
MICYRDRWWCAKFFTCAKEKDCDRVLTIKDIMYVDDNEIPVQFQNDPPCYEERVE